MSNKNWPQIHPALFPSFPYGCLTASLQLPSQIMASAIRELIEGFEPQSRGIFHQEKWTKSKPKHPGRWFHTYFLLHQIGDDNSPIDRKHFWKGLKPPTSIDLKINHWKPSAPICRRYRFSMLHSQQERAFASNRFGKVSAATQQIRFFLLHRNYT